MKFLGNHYIINTSKHGRVLVNLDESAKFGNAYFVMSRKFNKILSGVIDSKGNEIIPLDDITLQEMFFNPENTDSCFGFKYKDSNNLEYYHVKSIGNNKCKLILKTDRNDEYPLKIAQILANKDYWVVEKTNNPKQYAIYDYKESKFKTTFLNELIFLKDEELVNNHAIYYSMNVNITVEGDNDENKEVYCTSLCGFLDKNCNFSSQVLETKNEVLYDNYSLGGNTLSKRFSMLIADLERNGIEEYTEKENRLIDIRTYLHDNYDLSSNNKYHNRKAKILEFKTKGSDNNDKK